MSPEIESWLDQHDTVHARWLLKRLSANDTQLTGGHQAGFYIPREVLFRVLPDLERPELLNPKIKLDLYLDSHGSRVQPVATWYNNKLHGGTRNETRITSLGGSASPLLDVRNTGSLIIMAFVPGDNPIHEVHLWVCKDADEERCVEDRWGPVDPGQIVSFGTGQRVAKKNASTSSHDTTSRHKSNNHSKTSNNSERHQSQTKKSTQSSTSTSKLGCSTLVVTVSTILVVLVVSMV